jgi:hypothetical protein
MQAKNILSESSGIIMNKDAKMFLERLVDDVKLDVSCTVSMYELGEAIGYDRDAVTEITGTLISAGFIEIRTLAGGISITGLGLEVLDKEGVRSGNGIALFAGEIVDERSMATVKRVLNDLKEKIGNLSLEFSVLAELLADIKTIDVQLTSPKPKAAILKTCFVSIRSVLKKGGQVENIKQIDILLGASGPG